MDRGAWQVTAHRVARVGHNLVTKPSQKRLVIRDLVTVLSHYQSRKRFNRFAFI